jgi:3-oxoacyl-[acyl-carrier protein] reductase
MDLQLKDKVALVTGGARGLGRAVCRVLAREGAHVVVNSHQQDEEAKAFVGELQRDFGVDCLLAIADVAQEAAVVDMFGRAEQRMGSVEILVNNAAVCPSRWLVDTSLAEWSDTLAVNLTGSFLTSRTMARRLFSVGRSGRIVNVSSQAAFRGSTTGHAPYDASKGGLVSLTVSLARELAPHGIAVNAVAVGMMRTEMTAAALAANESRYLERIPLGRIADTAEIAEAIAFLASPRASYMTGATVDCSGGMLMR